MYLHKPAVIVYAHTAESMVDTIDLVWRPHELHTAHRF